MPLTAKGEEIKSNMAKTYGPEKGEKVFYASKNKGTISGVDEDKSEDLSKLKKGYGSAFMTVPPKRKDEAGEGEGSEVESWAGLMSDAEQRFDHLRDQLHAMDRRLDDCDVQDDDRSSEGHAEALAGLIAQGKPSSPEAKFHKAEVGREDDDCEK
jgi:hypothetical protein